MHRFNTTFLPEICRLAYDHWCSAMLQEIFRFLRNPRKPTILAMSRPDAKKNITTLVKAFGENPTLRELANLVLIMVSPARPLTFPS